MSGEIVLTTYPSEDSAVSAARRFLEVRLAACANILPIRSIYIWKEKLEDEREFLVVLKSVNGKVDELKSMIQKTHPYEVPEVMELKPNSVGEKYMRWLEDSLSQPTPAPSP